MMLSIHFSYLVNIIEFDAREKNQYVFWMGHVAWSQRTVYDAEYCFMEIWIVYITCVSLSFWVHICEHIDQIYAHLLTHKHNH